MAPRDRSVRLGVALTTAHLVWWLLLMIGIALWRHNPFFGRVFRPATIGEPGLYAVCMTLLAARWFWWGRRDDPGAQPGMGGPTNAVP